MKIRLRQVLKQFGGVTAVDGVSLEIGDGELFTLLGPSGCGKTTLLRLIAGFYTPDDGEINHLYGGRGFYFRDPNGHLLEVITHSYV